jgi:hypothetical protein
MSLFPVSAMPPAVPLPATFTGSAASLSPELAPRPPAPKRKREPDVDVDAGSDSAADSPGAQTPGAGSRPSTRDGGKKKKASRACVHCQKSHLTCDDGMSGCTNRVGRGLTQPQLGHANDASSVAWAIAAPRATGKRRSTSSQIKSSVCPLCIRGLYMCSHSIQRSSVAQNPPSALPAPATANQRSPRSPTRHQHHPPPSPRHHHHN